LSSIFAIRLITYGSIGNTAVRKNHSSNLGEGPNSLPWVTVQGIDRFASLLYDAFDWLGAPSNETIAGNCLIQKVSSHHAPRMESELKSLKFVAGLSLLIVLLSSGAAQGQMDNKEAIAKGQYIFSLAGGCACHSEPKGTQHAGARAFPIPFGKVFSTNLTADKETGLGDWTDQQISDAITKGIRRDGSRILPVMPYGPYSGMAQDDLKALIGFLRTLKPVRKPTPDLETSVPLLRSVAAEGWLKTFGNFFTSPATAPKSGVQRGKYLVDHVAICGDCHTPRRALGVPNSAMYLAGASRDIGPLGELVPNITPDKDTGIASWQRAEIADLLITGTKPDLDYVRGLMYDVVQGTSHGYRNMSREDALAIADYLKSIPAIKNKIK
jgi:mono/diheme cytochrome c family protein